MANQIGKRYHCTKCGSEFIVTKALVSAQPASRLPAQEEPCQECAPHSQAGGQQAGVVDQELEKEIEKLLAEIDKTGGGGDPLGIAVPWEEKHGGKKAKAKPGAGPAVKQAKKG